MNEDTKQKTLEFLNTDWPPTNALELYRMGWNQFGQLGKVVSIRAALAVYACRECSRTESAFEAKAVNAVRAWVLDPTEDKIRDLGRLAGTEEPGYSFARNLANMASRTNAWKSAVAFNISGNPALLSKIEFETFRDAIHDELLQWASNESDPVASRLAHETT